MIELEGAVGELRMRVQVTRKATGKVEEYDLVSYVDEKQRDELIKEGFIVPEDQEKQP